MWVHVYGRLFASFPSSSLKIRFTFCYCVPPWFMIWYWLHSVLQSFWISPYSVRITMHTLEPFTYSVWFYLIFISFLYTFDSSYHFPSLFSRSFKDKTRTHPSGIITYFPLHSYFSTTFHLLIYCLYISLSHFLTNWWIFRQKFQVDKTRTAVRKHTSLPISRPLFWNFSIFAPDVGGT